VLGRERSLEFVRRHSLGSLAAFRRELLRHLRGVHEFTDLAIDRIDD
jgi:hypothetical protein